MGGVPMQSIHESKEWCESVLCDCFKGDLLRRVFCFVSQKNAAVVFWSVKHYLILELVLVFTNLAREKLHCPWYGRKLFVTGERFSRTSFPNEHHQCHPNFLRLRLRRSRTCQNQAFMSSAIKQETPLLHMQTSQHRLQNTCPITSVSLPSL